MTDRPLRQSGGVGGYVGGWRVSLRLAARDMRKHRGRSVLVVLLIGLPLLLVSGGATFGFTEDVSATESITRSMGSSQALLRSIGDSGSVVAQSGNGSAAATGGSEGARTPLRFPGDPKTPRASNIEGVTGGTVLPVGDRYVRAGVGDRRIGASVLGIDGRKSAYKGMAKLVSGHWPANPHEVLVSRAGVAEGIPTSGKLTLYAESGKTTTVKVVGRAYTPNAQELVALPGDHVTSWILDRSAPVTWPEVTQLNRYGLLVVSRQVLLHPAQADADPTLDTTYYGNSLPSTVWVLLGVGLVLIITLLAGPAFAASGTRHRRALAQLASNGATKRQLRRYVLAQALLLGALSAFVCIVLGGLLGVLAANLHAHWSPTSPEPGPADFRWGWAGVLFLVAVVASLTSAMVPAIAAARINLIAVLRGHVSAARVRVGWPILGLVLAVAGGVVLTVALMSSGVHAQDVSPALTAGTIAGAVALFAGTLMTAPWLLTRLGLLARHLPLSLRVATRDISRQRGRAVAPTGAILATVAALTTLSIGFASSDRASAQGYQPTLGMGQGLVTTGTRLTHVTAVTAAVRRAIPDADIVQLHGAGSSAGSHRRFTAYTTGCTDAEALRAESGPRASRPCTPVFEDGDLPIVSATPEELRAAYRLTDADMAALRDGHLLLPAGALDGHGASTIRLVAGQRHGRHITSVQGVTLPLTISGQSEFAMVPQKQDAYSTFGSGQPAAALVSDTAARRIPGSHYTASLWIRAPGGISAAAEESVNEHLSSNAYLYVERGYDTAGAWIYLLIGGIFGLLVLVATLTATAMSNAESRADSATFASLGAPPSLRRRIAGANAAVVGLFGALLGLVVGLVAGIALSHPVTLVTDPNAQHTVTAIPWLELLGVTIGVPLLAAALAALATRGRIPMTRRLT